MAIEKSTKMFDSKRFTPEMLENELWDVLKKVRSKKIKPTEANSVICAAKEICNIARLRIQYQIISGGGPKQVELKD